MPTEHLKTDLKFFRGVATADVRHDNNMHVKIQWPDILWYFSIPRSSQPLQVASWNRQRIPWYIKKFPIDPYEGEKTKFFMGHTMRRPNLCRWLIPFGNAFLGGYVRLNFTTMDANEINKLSQQIKFMVDNVWQ